MQEKPSNRIEHTHTHATMKWKIVYFSSFFVAGAIVCHISDVVCTLFSKFLFDCYRFGLIDISFFLFFAFSFVAGSMVFFLEGFRVSFFLCLLFDVCFGVIYLIFDGIVLWTCAIVRVKLMVTVTWTSNYYYNRSNRCDYVFLWFGIECALWPNV